MKLDAGSHFLDGGGDMGALMRAKDWSTTPLGPVGEWPQSLRSAVSILLPSKAQIALFWGAELITLYNDAYRPVFGGKHPRALGLPIRESWSELWRAGLKELFERVLDTGEAYWAKDRPFYMERHGYPEETFFDVSYDPVRDESGGVGGVFCIVSETTGRVVGERRLKALRDMATAAADVRTVAEACARSIGVLAENPADVPFALAYLFDGDGAGLVATAGIGPHDAPGDWPLHERAEVHDLQRRFARVPQGPWPEPPSRAVVLPLMDRALERQSGALVLGISARAVFDDAYRGFFDLVAGQVAASIANARASEEERRRAEALAEVDRAKTAFFSNVSHEFRTPLTLMLGPVEDALADAQAPLPPEQRERMQLVRRSARRLQKLVNTLLDFSRIEAGRLQASYEPTDLAALTADLASSFRSAMDRAGLAYAIDCEPLGEPAYVDRDMWEKVVFNLLSNAFKFTFEGGVRLALRRNGACAELAVRDSGTGIPAGELPHVFERFRRVEGARSRTHEGTGIGLALVQELARLHGGTVRAESSEGGGSTFTVSIPLGRAHLPPERIGAPRELASTALGAAPYVEEALGWLAAEPLPRPTEPGSSRPRIVWADDNADMRDYVCRLLSDSYEVEACADGEAALQAARRARPDLLLADVMMPRLDGFGLLRVLRGDPALRDLPVILLSARAGEEARLEGLARGADDYLVKPFGARELLVRVESMLKADAVRRAAEDAVKDSERRLRAIIETTPECVKTVAADGTLIQMNAAGVAMVGASRAEALIGESVYQLIAAEDRERFRAFNEAVCRGEPGVLEFDIVGLDGRRRHMETHAAPLAQGDGTVVQLAITRDVSARRHSDQALRASEERYRRLMGMLPIAVYTCEAPSGVINYYNEHAAQLWGRTPRLGDTDERFCGSLRLWRPGGEALAHAETPMAIALLEGREFRNQEVTIERPDGSRITVLVNIDPIRDADGRIVGAINAFHDMTALKRAEESLKEADRRKDEFIATLSHELRNPLAPLRNALQLLRGSAGARDHAPLTGMMERQVNHLVRLVDDLLEISRISRGAFELRRERLSAAAIVGSAVETSEPLIQAARHRLSVSLAAEPLWLEGDAVRLTQILANLLDNAAKYTDPGGEIRIEARRVAGMAEITVRDNGPGIEPAALPRLFEMFSRGDAGGRGQGGLGIGLALARRLAEMHGGTLEGRTEGRGRGAQFSLRLPLAPGDAPAAPPAEQPQPVLPPRRVLVVDDNRDAAQTLGLLLGSLGAEVRLAFAGGEALEACQGYQPSLVLLDIGMPGMDGYEVARRLRAQMNGRRVSLVALTGWGQDEDRRRAREAGFDHHLVKPADLGALQALLHSLQ